MSRLHHISLFRSRMVRRAPPLVGPRAVECASRTSCAPAHLIPRPCRAVRCMRARGAGRSALGLPRNYFELLLADIRRRQHSPDPVLPAVEPEGTDPMGEDSNFQIMNHDGTMRPVTTKRT